MITKQASCSVRPRRQLVALGLLVAASTLDARADVCSGALPDPGLDRAAEAGKFALIAAACDLAPAAAPRAAAQLSLYERGSTTITLAIPAPGSDLAPPTPAPPSSPPSAPAPGSDRDIERILSVEPAFVAAARAYGVDPLLLHAIAHVESRHHVGAVSSAGAVGLMQVMPATARRFGIDDAQRALFDPATNLRACAAYLRTLRVRYGDDLDRVLAAYNAGEGAVDRYHGAVPPYPETQAYVRDVLAVYERLTATFAVAGDGTLLARGERR